MAEPDFTVKRYDYGTVISGVFRDSAGVAISLTGYTSAKVFMTRMGATTPTINGESFTVISAAAGTWEYVWQDGDTDLSGEYKMELEVELPGKRITYPTDPVNPYLIVLVQDDLGNADDASVSGMSFDFSLASNSSYLALV